jgi:hypothetical protein
MARQAPSTQPCGLREARVRREQARKFLEVAELVAGEVEIPASHSVSAALAVLAGIAASDAACCAALGRRPRGQDHRQAIPVLEQVEGGRKPAADLRRLLDLKDTAHYGLIYVSRQRLKSALDQASRLVKFASDVVAP